jgi:recombination protein RecA
MPSTSSCIDSVAALVTRQELEGEIGDSTVGAQARLMSAALRKLTAIISKARTTASSPTRSVKRSASCSATPKRPLAASALKFYASVRVDIRRIGAIKTTDGTVTGNRTKIKVVKNKLAPPYT